MELSVQNSNAGEVTFKVHEAGGGDATAIQICNRTLESNASENVGQMQAGMNYFVYATPTGGGTGELALTWNPVTAQWDHNWQGPFAMAGDNASIVVVYT
ncbi:hypothetical protein E1162_02240 [Rhodobacteraceae bacterium RKSG542]|uniref:hypothetical protein n=1 Tax=Pseudovibrio flavus TaxID=2529854 RepID=UPI0012BB6ECC|nr:hypothetical protein [Pseudovibrio flavus]MTI16054.1 hypothetical protein [Pseudovibrio flavus]